MWIPTWPWNNGPLSQAISRAVGAFPSGLHLFCGFGGGLPQGVMGWALVWEDVETLGHADEMMHLIW